MKILIADDSDYLRKQIISDLNNLGYEEIDSVGTEKDAKEIIEKNDYDLVLLDVIMENEKSGMKVLEQIRSKTQKTREAKLIPRKEKSRKVRPPVPKFP